METIAIEGGVALVVELPLHHVHWSALWVFHAGTSKRLYGFELVAMIDFGSGNRGGAFAVTLGVVEFTCFAVSKAYFVFLGDLAVDFVHRELVFYFCHFVFGIGLRCKRLCAGGGLGARWAGCVDFVEVVSALPRGSFDDKEELLFDDNLDNIPLESISLERQGIFSSGAAGS